MTNDYRPTHLGLAHRGGWLAAVYSLVALGATSLAAESLSGQSPRPIGITHVTIIDVERGTRLRDQTIVVEGNRIATVGLSSQVRIPDGYGVVEGRGKFVIPGLVDAYVPLVHDHRHYHDEHHQHAHDGYVPAEESHSHQHTHVRMLHYHPHYPDIHHRHDDKD